MTDQTAWEDDPMPTPTPLVAVKTEHPFHGVAPGRVSHIVYPTKYIVALGDLSVGFTFYGPFDTKGRAYQWVRDSLKPGTLYNIHNINEVRE